MNPELLNNSLFLRYYRQWQEDPTSIVFAPVAEYFLLYGMIDEAFTVCREGIKRYPTLVSGRIIMAKVHLKRGNWEEAEDELQQALNIMPENDRARVMLEEIEELKAREARGEMSMKVPAPAVAHVPHEERSSAPSWNTVTMAKIYATQGHRDRACEIYRTILKADPANEAARNGLDALTVAV